MLITNINRLLAYIKKKNTSIYIFGLSEPAKKFIQTYQINFSIKTIVDNNRQLHHSTYQDIPIRHPNQLKSATKGIVLIFSAHYESILYQIYHFNNSMDIFIDEKFLNNKLLNYFNFTINTPSFTPKYQNIESQQLFIKYLFQLFAEYNMTFSSFADKGLDIFEDKSVNGREILLSYHTTGKQTNQIYRFKNSYLNDYILVDKKGYSGWINFKRSALKEYKKDFSQEEIDTFFVHLQKKYINNNISFYKQQSLQNDFVFPKKFVFFPLQVLTDSVMKLSHFNPLALLHHVANILYKRKISLIVKPHPKCFDQELLLLIDALNKEKKIEIYHGSIHTAIKKATAVYVINSGVGFEALMHLKPVITFGKADYSLVTTTIKTVHELENKPIPTLTTEQKENIKLFLHFYIHTYLLDVNDKSSIIKNLNTFQLNSLWSMKIKSHESIEQWALTKQHTWDSKKKKTALLIGFESFMMKYMRDYLNNYNISYFDRHFSHIMMLKIIKKYYPSISIFIDKSFIKKEAFFIQTLYENNINFNIVEDGPIRSMGVYSTETRPLSLYIYKNTTSFKKTVANQLKKSSIEKRKLTKKIMEAYRKHHISKYSMPTLEPHINSISLNPNSTIILGSTDTTHDLKVIKQIKSNTDTPIFYKKHPNTISVHQPVYFNDAIENIVSIIPAEIPLSHILLYANEIHSLDSGAGFETLLYSKNVICHSPTWYSCYHLTQNTFKEKQYKGFTIEDLFWAAYIKLPIYYLNTIEETINKVSKQKDLYCTSNHTIR